MIDLHTHSIFSDGTYTPSEIIEEAESMGISAVALCDHDTTEGLNEFVIAANGKNIEAIPGVEFSTEHNGREIHLLALYVQPRYYNYISQLVGESHKKKELSNIELIGRLNKLGYTLSYAEIKSSTPAGQINRAHIATALTDKGYTNSIGEAFKTLLHPKNGLYKPPEHLQTLDVINEIKYMDAIAILAHPLIDLTLGELRTFLPAAKSCGLDGIEVFYSLYSHGQTMMAKQLAEEFDLKMSGGSDFHGTNKPGISLGTGKGNLCISEAILDSLKNERW